MLRTYMLIKSKTKKKTNKLDVLRISHYNKKIVKV